MPGLLRAGWHAARRHGGAWLAAALTLAAAGLGALQGLGQPDLMVADMTRLAPGAPDTRIVIVGIDDPSLAAIGRWPWSRLRHAELLEQLMRQSPRAIGLDLILSEPAAEDPLLADVLRRAGNVVLPLLDQPGGPPLQPVAALAGAAAGLGSVDIVIDADGAVRGLRLGTPAAPHFVRALGAVGAARGGPSPVSAPWAENESVLLGFHDAGRGIRQVPYADVLAGRAPPGLFSGAYVLVGVTGTGLGDAYPTPGLPDRGLRPGVDILATALDGLLNGRLARQAPAWANALANALPVLLAALLLLRLRADRGWLVALGLGAGLLAGTALLRRFGGVQVMPLAGLLLILLAYLAWSASWLRRALDFMVEELARLRTGHASGSTAPASRRLARDMDAVREETRALLRAKGLLEESLEALPDATLVVDAQGAVLVANAVARREFPALGAAPLRPIDALLHERFVGLRVAVPPATAETLAVGLNDGRGGEYVLKCVPRFGAGAEPAGWVVSVVDVRSAGAQERLKADTLDYLSHDMRSPQASILALVELRRAGALPGGEEELLDRIGRLAEKTLSYADTFIQLARAESAEYSLAPEDLLDIASEAADTLWPRAKAKGIAIDVQGEPAVCMVDRGLVFRAVQNLLDNAIKFSPAGSRIDCGVTLEEGRAILSVRDRGPGLGDAAATLFEPFHQLEGGAAKGGAGLGLSFVRTVARRHGGEAEAMNAPGEGGALLRIVLPSAPAEAG